VARRSLIVHTAPHRIRYTDVTTITSGTLKVAGLEVGVENIFPAPR